MKPDIRLLFTVCPTYFFPFALFVNQVKQQPLAERLKTIEQNYRAEREAVLSQLQPLTKALKTLIPKQPKAPKPRLTRPLQRLVGRRMPVPNSDLYSLTIYEKPGIGNPEYYDTLDEIRGRIEWCFKNQFVFTVGTSTGEVSVANQEPRFGLGRTVITPAALSACEGAGDNALTYLTRHHLGDWGEGFQRKTES